MSEQLNPRQALDELEQWVARNERETMGGYQRLAACFTAVRAALADGRAQQGEG